MSSFYGTPIRALRVPSLCQKCITTLITKNKREPLTMVILEPSMLRTSARDNISDENGRKRMEKPYFYFGFYIFWWKWIGFGKCGFGNRIRICRCTEMNKYGWRAKKLS
jgi:hypothetical protein